jgi:predicted Zn-dependent protease
MAGLLGTLARLDEANGSRRGVPNWALTHPPAADRVTRVGEVIAAVKNGPVATNKAEFERQLDGLVFGDSREKGIVRGGEFVHPILQFDVRFPQGWEIANTDEQVTATEREEGNVAMVLQPVGKENVRASVEQTARSVMANAGFQEVDGQRTTINGLPAYAGTYRGTVNRTLVSVRAAHIQAGGQTYILAGLATPAEFSRVEPAFKESIQSFRSISRQEADRIQPNRIDFYTVRSGDTWASIAGGVGDGVVKAATLAFMNGSDAGTPPRTGERIRVVVGGD